MPSARKANPEEKKSVRVVAVQSNVRNTDDHKSLPTLLQWVRKQPLDRDANILYPVNLIFFSGAYPSHTLVTDVFRARLNQSVMAYVDLVNVLQEIDALNHEMYLRVSGNHSGDFEIIVAHDQERNEQTKLRWIGSSDPFTGCAINYEIG